MTLSHWISGTFTKRKIHIPDIYLITKVKLFIRKIYNISVGGNHIYAFPE